MGSREVDTVSGNASGDEPERVNNDRIRKAQELVRQYIPEGMSLVDQLIEERRAENRDLTSERAEAVRALQARARQLVAPGTLVSDELISDHRDEASAE
jgi:hypothetical protein